MFEELGFTTGLDWLSVVIGTVFAFIMGALWYSPVLFGTQWMQAQPHRKKSDYQMAAMPMILQFGTTTMMVWFINILANTIGSIWGGFLLILFIGIESRAHSYFLGHSTMLWQIDFGYRATIVIIAVLTRGALNAIAS